MQYPFFIHTLNAVSPFPYNVYEMKFNMDKLTAGLMLHNIQVSNFTIVGFELHYLRRKKRAFDSVFTKLN